VRRFLALVVGITLIVASPAVGAGGSDVGEPGTGTEVEIVDSSLTVTAGHVSDLHITSGGGARPGRVIVCSWWDVQGGSFHEIENPGPVVPTEGWYYEIRCAEDGTMLPTYPRFSVYVPGTVAGPVTSTAEVAAFAVDSITFEAPAPALSPAGAQIVGIPTWLAVTSRLDYADVSAAAGPVWASVRPQFRDVTFTTALGHEVVCDTVAEATILWDPTGPDNQSSTCTYTYTANGPSESAVESHLTATVTWNLWQRTDQNPAEHFYGTHTETTVIPVTVRELQAVID